jgi:hypothetical protein
MEHVTMRTADRGAPRRAGLLVAVVLTASLVGTAQGAQVTVINMIPKAQSGETNQDSEPNLAVDPANPARIVGSAFTPSTGFCPANLAPVFASTDGGSTWVLSCIVPSDAAGTGTSDITVRFASSSGTLYAGILRRPGAFLLNVLRTNAILGPIAMTVLANRRPVDQPYVQATTIGGRDRVYVGDNSCCPPSPGGRTATIDQSLDAGIPAPAFTTPALDVRATAGQDGPPIRPALHPDGTVYAAFYHWTARTGNFSPNATITADVVVVRDDAGGAGPTPFSALVDSGDGLAGVRVVQGRTVPWANTAQANFGQERFVGSNLSLAVDPRRSATVYLAWADRADTGAYTLHVRRSLDRGVTWSNDLRTIPNATNPALAINSDGTVGFLYQQVVRIVTGAAVVRRWVTHLERTDDAFTTVQDLVLANVPADTPAPAFLPYIGDYVHLLAVGRDFYGIFSANNTPDTANFPNGVTYHRNANFVTRTLLGPDNQTPVNVSIDPFFFKVEAERARALQYAAKFVCGKGDGRVVAPGAYFTAINVHNPGDQVVAFRKKIAIALPGERPGPVSRFFDAKLGPDQALEIDCPDIVRHAAARGDFLKGFVVIETDVELDVVAVYSAAGATRQIETLELERVPARGRKPAGRADLLPVPDGPGPLGFCRRDSQGNLLVRIRNQGDADAPASTTTVEFGSGGVFSVPTPAISAGTSTDLTPVAMPGACFTPDCGFRITADSASVIDETDETNNHAVGQCIG